MLGWRLAHDSSPCKVGPIVMVQLLSKHCFEKQFRILTWDGQHLGIVWSTLHYPLVAKVAPCQWVQGKTLHPGMRYVQLLNSFVSFRARALFDFSSLLSPAFDYRFIFDASISHRSHPTLRLWPRELLAKTTSDYCLESPENVLGFSRQPNFSCLGAQPFISTSEAVD